VDGGDDDEDEEDRGGLAKISAANGEVAEGVDDWICELRRAREEDDWDLGASAMFGSGSRRSR